MILQAGCWSGMRYCEQGVGVGCDTASRVWGGVRYCEQGVGEQNHTAGNVRVGHWEQEMPHFGRSQCIVS